MFSGPKPVDSAKTEGVMAKKNKTTCDENVVNRHHDELKEKVSKLVEYREFVKSCLSTPQFSAILGRYSQEIEAKKESLISCEKKDVERLQAEIVSRRELLSDLKSSYDVELEDARKQLQEFERQHALFLSGESREEVTEGGASVIA